MSSGNYRHGGHGTSVYGVWRQMRQRCANPNHPFYADYGGRGITVTAAWQDFANFQAWAKASGHSAGLQIDRIDNDGPYAPENCRWVGRTQNANNKRNNVFVRAFGESKTLSEWARDSRCVVSYTCLYLRVYRRGWDFATALTTPTARRAA